MTRWLFYSYSDVLCACSARSCFTATTSFSSRLPLMLEQMIGRLVPPIRDLAFPHVVKRKNQKSREKSHSTNRPIADIADAPLPARASSQIIARPFHQYANKALCGYTLKEKWRNTWKNDLRGFWNEHKCHKCLSFLFRIIIKLFSR